VLQVHIFDDVGVTDGGGDAATADVWLSVEDGNRSLTWFSAMVELIMASEPPPM